FGLAVGALEIPEDHQNHFRAGRSETWLEVSLELVQIALEGTLVEIVNIALDDVVAVLRDQIGLVRRAAVVGEVDNHFVESGKGTAGLGIVDTDGDLRQPQLDVAQIRLNLGFVERLPEQGRAQERGKNREISKFHRFSYYDIRLSELLHFASAGQDGFRAHF